MEASTREDLPQPMVALRKSNQHRFDVELGNELSSRFGDHNGAMPLALISRVEADVQQRRSRLADQFATDEAQRLFVLAVDGPQMVQRVVQLLLKPRAMLAGTNSLVVKRDGSMFGLVSQLIQPIYISDFGFAKFVERFHKSSHDIFGAVDVKKSAAQPSHSGSQFSISKQAA